VAATGAAAQTADNYPSRPIRIIVPQAAGSGIDLQARTLAQKMGELWGQPGIVENRPGANAIIGTDAVAKAAPDGYTLVLAPAGNLTVNPSLYRSMPYDVGRDFAPITVLATVPNILVVHPSVPAKTVAELVQYAKAHPGELNFSSPGNGSGAHLAGELLKSMAKVDMTHIPFNGIAPAVTAVLGGQVQAMFAGAPSVLQHVKSGTLRALGVASLARMPTLAESGFPGFDVTSWYGIVAPAGTPSQVIDRLHGEMTKALNEPDVREKLAGLGAEPVGNTPAEFAATIRSETAKWSKIVKDAKITAE
jgi:tripartite-type tricarboxylate transporter receptor subunit TctC